jgi:D-glycero-alpha-D-manno-heptose-7-phosphate kinase
MKFYAKSPVRISLCNGGDTDYYIKEMGWTNLINATLDSGFYSCSVEEKKQNFIDYSYKNMFSRTGNFRRIYDLSSEEKDIKIITETIKKISPDFKGEIKMFTNVPEKSGLGGSSTLIVSLIKALIKAKNIKMTPDEIAWTAYDIERIKLGIKGGYQDQWAAAFSGGVNYLEFRNKKVFIEPLWLSEILMRKLEDNLVLFFMEPRKGDSGNIHAKLEARMKQKGKKEDINMMLKRRENVAVTREALLNGDLKKFSELLNIEQKSKEILMKDLLTQKTKKIYDAAIANGAIAGKISGAGSGGCAFFVYDKKDKNKFIKKMNEFGCINLPLKLQRMNSMGEI